MQIYKNLHIEQGNEYIFQHLRKGFSAPAHLFHTFDGADFLDELFELGSVVDHDGEGA